MAKKIVPDPPLFDKLQLSPQEELQLVHQKIAAMLNMLLLHTDLSACSAADLHVYLSIISDLVEQAISLFQQIIVTNNKGFGFILYPLRIAV